jgi:hypothetical protein
MGDRGFESVSLQRRVTCEPDFVTTFPLERAGEALAALRDRRLDARAVLQLGEARTLEAL